MSQAIFHDRDAVSAAGAVDLADIGSLKIQLGLTERIVPVYARTQHGEERLYILKVTKKGLSLI
jgi:hypothetical protein